ncbi:MAG: hypothetical protein J6K46_05550, partial [Sutterella sp.]|nr:hypothetical protein [Sutterella sp.]
KKLIGFSKSTNETPKRTAERRLQADAEALQGLVSVRFGMTRGQSRSASMGFLDLCISRTFP